MTDDWVPITSEYSYIALGFRPDQLRDLFAGLAMQAIIAKAPCVPDEPDEMPRMIAAGAYDYANAMMEARK